MSPAAPHLSHSLTCTLSPHTVSLLLVCCPTMARTPHPFRPSSSLSTISSATRLRSVSISSIIHSNYSNISYFLGQTFPNSVLLRTASLGFYEAVLTLPLAHNLQILVIPTATFTYSCFLAEDIMSISRICGIIAR